MGFQNMEFVPSKSARSAGKNYLKQNLNMKKSTVHFSIELDDNNFPEKILWDATDKPEAGPSETKSISVGTINKTTPCVLICGPKICPSPI